MMAMRDPVVIKRCAKCGEEKPINDFGLTRGYRCKRCEADATYARRWPDGRPPIICIICGSSFVYPVAGGIRKTCSGECGAEHRTRSQKSWRDRNPDSIKASNSRFWADLDRRKYNKNRSVRYRADIEHYRACARESNNRYTAALTDGYIRFRLVDGIPIKGLRALIPIEMIQAKRIQLKLQRELKRRKRHEQNYC